MKTLDIRTYDRESITIIIDESAISKFDRGVIKEDDDVTVKCIEQNGKLKSESFVRKLPV